MAEKEALDRLLIDIKQRIEDFKEDRKFYRGGAKKYILGTAFLSAGTTFFIAINEMFPNQKYFAIIALTFGFLLTVLTAWDSYYTHRPRWVQSNEALMNLYALKSDIEFQNDLKGKITESEIIKYYERYKDILNNANSNWKESRLEKK